MSRHSCELVRESGWAQVAVRLPALVEVMVLVHEWCGSVDAGWLVEYASPEEGTELVSVYSPAGLAEAAGNRVRVTVIGVVNRPEEEEAAAEAAEEAAEGLEQVLGVLGDQSHCRRHRCHSPLDPVPAKWVPLAYLKCAEGTGVAPERLLLASIVGSSVRQNQRARSQWASVQ